MSLRDAILSSFEGNMDKRAEEIINSRFLSNRQAWTNDVINGYMKHGADMNLSIAKIAKENNLNNDQVMRIVEEANVGVYLQKYAQTKGQRVRRVEFPLADPMKIGVMEKAASEVVVTDEEVKTMLQKVAAADETRGRSTMTFDVSQEKVADSMFTNPTENYDYSIWDGEQREKCASEMLKRKLHERIERDKQEKIASIRDMLHKVAYVGDAIIYNERSGQDSQELFNKIASDASLHAKAQIPIIRYVQEKVASMKEERYLPKNFNLTLEVFEKTANAFSLGSHSLLSKTAESSEYDSLKDLSLPNGVDYTKLVNISRSITDQISTDGKVNLDVEHK